MTLPTQDVLILMLEEVVPVKEMYSRLIKSLESSANVVFLADSKEAAAHLADASKVSALAGVLVVDSGITQKRNKAIALQLTEYARNGGVVIVGFGFPRYTRPVDADAFFEKRLGMSWRLGTHRRETFALSESVGPFIQPKYREAVKEYRAEAVMLKDVKEEFRVYVSTQEENQTPVVFEQIGDGYLGWVGDVNGEDPTTGLVLAMLNI